MITIICGEDTLSSRKYFNVLKDNFKKQDYAIKNISPHELNQIPTLQANSPNLFGKKTVYFSENLLAKLKGKSLSLVDEIIIVDWEEKPQFELKIPKGLVVKEIREFKPSISIFKLLDACYPGNLSVFLKIIHQLPLKMEDGFILNILAKYIRNLLLIKMGQKSSKLQSWQLNKLKNQARFWSLEKLLAFYEGLYRIELATKTSTNPYNIRESLDILSCYFL